MIDMSIFFGLIPSEFYRLISPISLILLGFVIDNKAQNPTYVGRLSMFSNSMALASFYIFIPNTPLLMKIIINFAVILGIIGIIAYARGKSLKTDKYYKYTKWFSPVVTGVIILIYYILPGLFTT